ncbi:MAG TPA: pyridoxamine 5'-phosphate oxidase family protein [Flexivirga sp.]|uniref:pyridoxamine 5'-phosphate oxidase family protein n=1 Tax=Flexivirga sp. TaxID=1962927 RepID=UPI002BF33677|nr:pyridoxamine 5'-phosphate oxidase family protein [Flexivirga sp.]HWC22264.1 pyridoxamine 5'-phosphate oxidase family protein [Flexivirga sp.]
MSALSVDGILGSIRYLVLGTADADGNPWTSPVFFALLDRERVCWVSSPQSRHSRNIAEHPAIAITVFDSTVAVGSAEAAYFDATAAALPQDEVPGALAALNARLPAGKELDTEDLEPAGPLVAYAATLRRRYVLVRGGSTESTHAFDTTVEI